MASLSNNEFLICLVSYILHINSHCLSSTDEYRVHSSRRRINVAKLLLLYALCSQNIAIIIILPFIKICRQAGEALCKWHCFRTWHPSMSCGCRKALTHICMYICVCRYSWPKRQQCYKKQHNKIYINKISIDCCYVFYIAHWSHGRCSCNHELIIFKHNLMLLYWINDGRRSDCNFEF